MSEDWDAVASEIERRMDRIEARMDAIDRHFDRLAEQMSSLVSNRHQHRRACRRNKGVRAWTSKK